MKIWLVRMRRKWIALRQLRSAGLGWYFLRVACFAAAVPILMRLKLPVLHRLLERRIASAAGAEGDSHGPGEIVRCVESALTVGTPLVRPGCLTRGLTLYYFLRRAGVDVTLRFGARWRNGELMEEAGHCWLEKGGAPFLENGNPYRYSVPIYSLPATCPQPARPG
jgi:Transglutaminase-like superfamily